MYTQHNTRQQKNMIVDTVIYSAHHACQVILKFIVNAYDIIAQKKKKKIEEKKYMKKKSCTIRACRKGVIPGDSSFLYPLGIM